MDHLVIWKHLGFDLLWYGPSRDMGVPHLILGASKSWFDDAKTRAQRLHAPDFPVLDCPLIRQRAATVEVKQMVAKI